MLVTYRQRPPMAPNVSSTEMCGLALAGELLLGRLVRAAGTACEDLTLPEQGS